MDTQVKGTVVWFQSAGLLPTEMTTFYRDAKPSVTALEGKRVCFIGSKIGKDGKQREKMAVQVAQLNPDDFSDVTGHKFLTALLNDYQDGNTVRVADGEFGMEFVNDREKMIADYFDTSRDSSGRKITKEKIAEYFMDSSLAKCVSTRALLKNAQMTEQTLGSLLKGYAEMFGRLTKFDLKSIFTEVQAKLIRQLIDGSEEDGSEMREWIKVKFAKVEAAMTETANLLDAI